MQRLHKKLSNLIQSLFRALVGEVAPALANDSAIGISVDEPLVDGVLTEDNAIGGWKCLKDLISLKRREEKLSNLSKSSPFPQMQLILRNPRALAALTRWKAPQSFIPCLMWPHEVKPTAKRQRRLLL